MLSSSGGTMDLMTTRYSWSCWEGRADTGGTSSVKVRSDKVNVLIGQAHVITKLVMTSVNPRSHIKSDLPIGQYRLGKLGRCRTGAERRRRAVFGTSVYQKSHFPTPHLTT